MEPEIDWDDIVDSLDQFDEEAFIRLANKDDSKKDEKPYVSGTNLDQFDEEAFTVSGTNVDQFDEEAFIRLANKDDSKKNEKPSVSGANFDQGILGNQNPNDNKIDNGEETTIDSKENIFQIGGKKNLYQALITVKWRALINLYFVVCCCLLYSAISQNWSFSGPGLLVYYI